MINILKLTAFLKKKVHGSKIREYEQSEISNYKISTCQVHTFLGFIEEVDPFWLCGDWLLSDSAAGEEGREVGGSERTKGMVPSSRVNICLGVDRLCGGIMVRLLGFLQPYRHTYSLRTTVHSRSLETLLLYIYI